MRNHPTRAALAALIVMSCLGRIPAGASPQSDRWFEMRMAGVVVGHTHEVVTVRDDSLFVTSVESRVSVERFGEAVDIEEKSEWIETADGATRSCLVERRLAAGELLTIRVSVEPGRLVVERQGSRSREPVVIPTTREMSFPRAVASLHAERGFVPGDRYAYSTFDPDFESVCRMDVTVIGADTVDVAGERRGLNLLAVARDLYAGLVTHEWRDQDGDLWMEDSPELGISNARVTRERATRGAGRADILAETLIPSNVCVTDPRSVDEALYELSLEGGDVSDLIIEDDRQSVEGRTGAGVLLRVRRVVPASETTARVPMALAGLEAFMEDSPFIQSGDPAVAAVASDVAEAAGADAWERAIEVERRVSRLITRGSLDTAFASAAETLEQGSGDCTEHAVLAAAIARAAGVPSRIAAGVVHMGGGFAYHMWVEVWTGRGWHALDPTIGDESVDATHIKLVESPLSEGRLADLSLGILRTMNRLNIRIVEYTYSGRTIQAE